MHKQSFLRFSLKRALHLACVAALGLGVAGRADNLNLEQLKAISQARADKQFYPFIGMDPNEVREALSHVNSLDPKEWAAAWSTIGDKYAQKARDEEKQSPQAASDDYVKAWLYYTMGRWPAPDNPAKEESYKKAVNAYLDHGKLLDPPLQIARVPYEGKEAIAYIQMPKGVAKAPIVIGIGGLDSRKEDMAERLRPLLALGIGYMALDPPGGGQAPVKAGHGAENMLAAEVDYAFSRPDVDPKRVAIYGASMGGYWSTILAAMEGHRLRAVVSQSPPVDDTFSREHTMALSANTEYFFSFVEALEFMFNANNLEELAKTREEMSLKTLGMLDKPMAPMLVIAGAKDTQVPIGDIELLLRTGQSPKDAWINPLGGHMGRDAQGWSDTRVFREVAMPWLANKLTAEPDRTSSATPEK